MDDDHSTFGLLNVEVVSHLRHSKRGFLRSICSISSPFLKVDLFLGVIFFPFSPFHTLRGLGVSCLPDDDFQIILDFTSRST